MNFLVLAAGCLPLLIYTNVIYGEVLAVAWTAFALWMLLLWLKEGRIWQIVLMIIGLCFAVGHPPRTSYSFVIADCEIRRARIIGNTQIAVFPLFFGDILFCCIAAPEEERD